MTQPEDRVIVPGEAPFSPPLILMATLLTSIIGGGFLAMLNWDRFYRPARKWPTFLGVIGAFLLVGIPLYVAYAATGQAVWILAGAVLNALGGVALVLWQRTDYAVWVVKHGLPTREQMHLQGVLWAPGLILFVLVGILLPLMTVTLLPAIRAGLPPRAFEGGGLTLQYPANWLRLDVGDDAVCQQVDTTCLISLRADSGLLVFDAVRVDAADNPAAPAAAADALWAEVSGDEGAALAAREPLTLGGLPAVWLSYRQDSPYASGQGQWLHVQRWLVAHEGVLYRFSAVADRQSVFSQHDDQLSQLLSSLTFDGVPVP
jgi:hypothetical protein